MRAGLRDAVYEILKSKNAALCWAESEKIVVPKVATADFLYYRFREPEYSTPDLQKVAEELKTQSEEREVFAFFKHEEQPESALNAVTVARLNGIEEKPFVMPEKKAGKRGLKPNRYRSLNNHRDDAVGLEIAVIAGIARHRKTKSHNGLWLGPEMSTKAYFGSRYGRAEQIPPACSQAGESACSLNGRRDGDSQE